MVVAPAAKRSRIALLYLIFAVPLASIGVYATSVMFASPMPENNVAVATSSEWYRAGETVVFTITNNSTKTVTIENHCPGESLAVYRRNGSEWVRLHAQASPTKCAGESRDFSIPPHSYITSDYSAWPQLFTQPGQYRIVAEVTGTDAAPATEFNIAQQ